MRSFLLLLALVAFFLAACAAQTPIPVAVPTSVPTSTDTPLPPSPTPLPQRQPVLRVAVLGNITTTNVWEIFDGAGADYWTVATQSSYWPRLYRLAPPSLDFQPAIAKGMPSTLVCDSTACTATVTVQSHLTWSNGSALTAYDVAFTINTALQFHLGLNWQAAYNPDVLDRAEPLNESVIKFHFKTRPTVADWQYGVLLGPIVSQAYWQPRILEAASLLPDETLTATIQNLESQYAKLQANVDALSLSLNTMVPGSPDYEQTARQAKGAQDELNSLSTKLEKNRTTYDAKLAEARASLFQLANANEPTLGPWKFASRLEDSFKNQANLGTPFGDPWFDNVSYLTYSDEAAAVDALINDDVDLVLTPQGLSPASLSRLGDVPGITFSRNVTRSARFLAFNHANPYLAEPTLHRALACMLDPAGLVESLGEDAVPLPGFVLDGSWQNEQASLPCFGATGASRLAAAVRMLKEAGYSWDQEPALNAGGSGLKAPDGNILPAFTLFTLEQDPEREAAANYIARQADILGLKLDVRTSNSDDMVYAVYGSGDYDLAVLGWRLSTYPAYLCEWFQSVEENPFAYNGSSLKSACDAWAGVNDLEKAKNEAFEIQSTLVQDLPLIPLYADVRVDAYRNIRYPFSQVIDGLGGLYGAPALAIPIP